MWEEKKLVSYSLMQSDFNSVASSSSFSNLDNWFNSSFLPDSCAFFNPLISRSFFCRFFILLSVSGSPVNTPGPMSGECSFCCWGGCAEPGVDVVVAVWGRDWAFAVAAGAAPGGAVSAASAAWRAFLASRFLAFFDCFESADFAPPLNGDKGWKAYVGYKHGMF